MEYFISMNRPALVTIATAIFSFFNLAIAQNPPQELSANCGVKSERAAGLRYIATSKTLSDFSIVISENEKNKIIPADFYLLQGNCAGSVYAFRMSQIVFNDGSVYTAQSPDGLFTYDADPARWTNFGREALSNEYPEIRDAKFKMASMVDYFHKPNEKPVLDVGVWQTEKYYFIAAFIRKKNGFSIPIEILRSKKPIKSVTFFPSIDTNTGKLGVLLNSDNDIALINLNWDHSALSKILLSEK